MSTWHLTEVFRHGSIFSSLRAWIESRGLFWETLIECGFCTSHWMAGISTFILFLGHLVCAQRGHAINPFLLLMVWLSATRGANVLNDVTKKWNKSPSREDIEIEEINLDDLEHNED